MRKAKLTAVVLILLMSFFAYYRHLNPARYPPSHMTIVIANSMDRIVRDLDELDPDRRDQLTMHTELLMRNAQRVEQQHRQANRPFAFVIAGVCLLSLMYMYELRTEDKGNTQPDPPDADPEA